MSEEALTKSDQHHKESREEAGFEVRFPSKKKVTAYKRKAISPHVIIISNSAKIAVVFFGD